MAVGGRKTQYQVVHEISKQFGFGQTSGVIGVLPAGAILNITHLLVSQAWNATTSPPSPSGRRRAARNCWPPPTCKPWRARTQSRRLRRWGRSRSIPRFTARLPGPGRSAYGGRGRPSGWITCRDPASRGPGGGPHGDLGRPESADYQAKPCATTWPTTWPCNLPLQPDPEIHRPVRGEPLVSSMSWRRWSPRSRRAPPGVRAAACRVPLPGSSLAPGRGRGVSAAAVSRRRKSISSYTASQAGGRQPSAVAESWGRTSTCFGPRLSPFSGAAAATWAMSLRRWTTRTTPLRTCGRMRGKTLIVARVEAAALPGFPLRPAPGPGKSFPRPDQRKRSSLFAARRSEHNRRLTTERIRAGWFEMVDFHRLPRWPIGLNPARHLGANGSGCGW